MHAHDIVCSKYCTNDIGMIGALQMQSCSTKTKRVRMQISCVLTLQ